MSAPIVDYLAYLSVSIAVLYVAFIIWRLFRGYFDDENRSE
jgi:nitrogen fixation-related uncharacterized protein